MLCSNCTIVDAQFPSGWAVLRWLCSSADCRLESLWLPQLKRGRCSKCTEIQSSLCPFCPYKPITFPSYTEKIGIKASSTNELRRNKYGNL